VSIPHDAEAGPVADPQSRIAETGRVGLGAVVQVGRLNFPISTLLVPIAVVVQFVTVALLAQEVMNR
jgi:hypothetical protein